MVQEKKGMLKVWNILLVILTFVLSLFGTFLTRSGVVNSIHSFTQGAIGPWFLTFICLVVIASRALFFSRLPLLRSRTKFESLVSREATFLYNNLLLVALCLTVLWGVLFPMLSEAVRGETRVFGPPYVVHAAIVLLAIGVAGSSSYQTIREQNLRSGETLRVQNYTLRYQGRAERQGANARELRATIDVGRGGKRLGRPGAG